MSQESKRLPNKPFLTATTKRPPSNKNIKKCVHSFTQTKNNIKKNLSDPHFDDISLNTKQQNDKQENINNDFLDDSINANSCLTPQKLSISLKINSSNGQLFNKNPDNINDERIAKLSLSSNNSRDHFTENLQYDYSNDTLTNSSNFDEKLGQQIRKIFNDLNDNDSIINDVKIMIQFIHSLSPASNSKSNYSIESSISFLNEKIFENEKLRAKTENLESQLKKFCNNDDQYIIKTVKSFYQNQCNNSKKINQLFENDLNFSMEVKNIFNQTDNYEAIIRTIQSNKETADDNRKIEELTQQIQQLNKNAEINKEIFIQNAVIQEIKDKYEQNLKEKDSQINELKNSIDELNKLIEKLNNSIENCEKENCEEKNKFENEIKQIESLKNQIIKENIEQINSLKQSYEIQIEKLNIELSNLKDFSQKVDQENSEIKILISQKENEMNKIKKENDENKMNDEQKNEEIANLKEELSEKKIELNQLRSEMFDHQRLAEEKLKENKELRNFIKNGEDIKDKEIDYLKKELLSSLEKQKKIESQLSKLNKKYEDSLNKISPNIDKS